MGDDMMQQEVFYFFDVYQGKGVEDGKKSLAITVTLQPMDETLTDETLADSTAEPAPEDAEETSAAWRLPFAFAKRNSVLLSK